MKLVESNQINLDSEDEEVPKATYDFVTYNMKTGDRSSAKLSTMFSPKHEKETSRQNSTEFEELFQQFANI